MAYIYILKSLKDSKQYIGSTVNLSRRLFEHEKSRVRSTKFRKPFVLIGYREFETIEEAAIFEKKYKNSHGQVARDFKNGKIKVPGSGVVVAR